jgi:hypothetical protein
MVICKEILKRSHYSLVIVTRSKNVTIHGGNLQERKLLRDIQTIILMKFDPNWISGFVDGEGTFYIGINKQSSMSVGYQVLPEFRIVQHERDVQLLHALKDYFNTGVVRINHGDRYELRVRNLSMLTDIIIPFFGKYPLHTQKKHDFTKFAKIVKMMNSGEHLDVSGLIKIIDIASKMNRADKQKALEIRDQLSKDKSNVHTCEKS